MSRKQYGVGYIGKSQTGGLYQVAVMLDNRECVVRFFETGTLLRVSMARLSQAEAQINDPMRKSAFGIGYVGKGEYSPTTHREAYSRFRGMYDRCYSGVYPSYKGVVVCEDWHNFQNFAEWFYAQEHKIGYDVDKDVMGDGTLYSPSTCCMLPTAMNKIFVKPVKRKEGFEHLPRYVTYQAHKSRYVVQLRGESEWRESMYSAKFRVQDYPSHEAAIEAARIHAKEKGIEFYTKGVWGFYNRGEISEVIRDKALEKIALKHKEK